MLLNGDTIASAVVAQLMLFESRVTKMSAFDMHTPWIKHLFWRYHDDVIKGKHFPHYWPFVRGIHQSPVNSPHKSQWRGALIFSLICAWINGWAIEMPVIWYAIVPVTGEFPSQKPVTRSFDIFFDLRLNKRLSHRDAGDLIRYRTPYDATIMICSIWWKSVRERTHTHTHTQPFDHRPPIK